MDEIMTAMSSSQTQEDAGEADFGEINASFLDDAAREEERWRREGRSAGRRAKAMEGSHTMQEASRLGAAMGTRLGKDAGESAGAAEAWKVLSGGGNAMVDRRVGVPAAAAAAAAAAASATSATGVDTDGQQKATPPRRRVGGKRARAAKAADTVLQKVDSLGLRNEEGGEKMLAALLVDATADVQGTLDAARDAARLLRAIEGTAKVQERDRLSF